MCEWKITGGMSEEISELHIKHLRDRAGKVIDVPVVVIKGSNGEIVKKMTYKQFKMAWRELPPFQLSKELQQRLCSSNL